MSIPTYPRFENADDPAYLDSVRQYAARRGVYATSHDLDALARDLWALTPREARWVSAEAMASELPGVALGDALPGYMHGREHSYPRLPRPGEMDGERFYPGDLEPDVLPGGLLFADWVALVAALRSMMESNTTAAGTALRVLDFAADLLNALDVNVRDGAGEMFARHAAGQLGLDVFARLAGMYRVSTLYRWDGDLAALETDDDEGENGLGALAGNAF